MAGGHVFVSYARADIDYVRRLVDFLRGAGVDVWFDEQIPTSARWDQVLESRIDTCTAVVTVMSVAARESYWVGVELDHARRRQRPVFPLLLDGEPLFGLGVVQFESVKGGRMPSPAFVQHLRNLPDDATSTAAPGSAALRVRPAGLVPAVADVDRLNVLRSTGWIHSLTTLYPDYPLLDFFGRPAPICVFPAGRPEWGNMNAAIGVLIGDHLPAHDEYPDGLDPAARAEFEHHLRTVIPGRKWNGAAYALDRIRFDAGFARIDCRPGRYFLSLATSEACDQELMHALAADPRREVGLADLPRREYVHRVAGDPVMSGMGRSSAVSAAMTILMRTKDGGYAILLAPRSGEVATHPYFNHIAPSGIFAPLDVDLTSIREEFSVEATLLREYVEELYSIEEYEVGTKPFHQVRREPEIVRLRSAIESGAASLYYTGVSVNLLTLRPEICTLLLVHDPEWLPEEMLLAEQTGRPWKMAWEWLSRVDEHRLPSGRQHQHFLALDANLRPNRTDDPSLQPAALIPNAAAAIHLALEVASHVV